jgi:hypothetical protein
MERGGHVPFGVTAPSSPSGPLQFERLEAALRQIPSLSRGGQNGKIQNFNAGQRHDGIGEAAHGQVRKNSATEFRCSPHFRTAKYHRSRNSQENHRFATSRPARKGADRHGPGRRPESAPRIENTLTDEHGDVVSLKRALTSMLPSRLEPPTGRMRADHGQRQARS